MRLILARVKQHATKEISAQALTKFLVVCEFSCLILQIQIFQDDLGMNKVCKIQMLQLSLKIFSVFPTCSLRTKCLSTADRS